jgi:hypothetical protein
MANVPEDIKQMAPKGKHLVQSAVNREIVSMIAVAYSYGRSDRTGRVLSTDDQQSATLFERAVFAALGDNPDAAHTMASLHDIYASALAAQEAAGSPQLTLEASDLDTED